MSDPKAIPPNYSKPSVSKANLSEGTTNTGIAGSRMNSKTEPEKIVEIDTLQGAESVNGFEVARQSLEITERGHSLDGLVTEMDGRKSLDIITDRPSMDTTRNSGDGERSKAEILMERRIKRKAVMNWTNEEVCFVLGKRLHFNVEGFMDERLSGADLFVMTNDDAKDLGLPLKQRIRFFRFLKYVKQNGGMYFPKSKPMKKIPSSPSFTPPPLHSSLSSSSLQSATRLKESTTPSEQTAGKGISLPKKKRKNLETAKDGDEDANTSSENNFDLKEVHPEEILDAEGEDYTVDENEVEIEDDFMYEEKITEYRDPKTGKKKKKKGLGHRLLSAKESGTLDKKIPRSVVFANLFLSVNAICQALADIVIEVLILFDLLPKLPLRVAFLSLTALSALLGFQTLKGMRKRELDVTKDATQVNFVVEIALVADDIYFILTQPNPATQLAALYVRITFVFLTSLNVLCVVYTIIRLQLFRSIKNWLLE